MIGEFDMGGETVNTFNGFNVGPIQFRGRITDGKIDITDKDVIENETVIKIAKDGKIVNETVVVALKNAGIFDPSADDLELVKLFVAGKLINELQILQQAAPAAPAPTAAPVSSVDVTQQKTLFRAFEKVEKNMKKDDKFHDVS